MLLSIWMAVTFLASVVTSDSCGKLCKEKQSLNESIRRQIKVLGAQLIDCLATLPEQPDHPITMGKHIPATSFPHDHEGYMVQLYLRDQLLALVSQMRTDISLCKNMAKESSASGKEGKQDDGDDDIDDFLTFGQIEDGKEDGDKDNDTDILKEEHDEGGEVADTVDDDDDYVDGSRDVKDNDNTVDDVSSIDNTDDEDLDDISNNFVYRTMFTSDKRDGKILIPNEEIDEILGRRGHFHATTPIGLGEILKEVFKAAKHHKKHPKSSFKHRHQRETNSWKNEENSENKEHHGKHRHASNVFEHVDKSMKKLGRKLAHNRLKFAIQLIEKKRKEYTKTHPAPDFDMFLPF